MTDDIEGIEATGRKRDNRFQIQSRIDRRFKWIEDEKRKVRLFAGLSFELSKFVVGLDEMSCWKDIRDTKMRRSLQ